MLPEFIEEREPDGIAVTKMRRIKHGKQQVVRAKVTEKDVVTEWEQRARPWRWECLKGRSKLNLKDFHRRYCDILDQHYKSWSNGQGSLF